MDRELRSFNDVDTIYEKNLVTVCLKRQREYIADPDGEPKAESPREIYELLKAIYDLLSDDQEHLVMLVLNVGNEVSGYKVIASGTQTSGTGDAKIIFRNALMLGAAKIVLAHNHPSGSLKPSAQDIAFTEKMIELGRALSLPLVDHVIYTNKGYFSMRAENACRFEPFV
ncbi:MAG: JAB domain-containing protein [Thiohalomonadaceae bacterium]